MGMVNTGLTRYCNCYRSLTDINPIFDSNTPMYVVIDEMTSDRAEYDIDVKLELPTALFWKSYPENGKTHVVIESTVNTSGEITRTVTCTCESGRIYKNIFTQRPKHVYHDVYRHPTRTVALDYVDYITKYAIDSSRGPYELGISKEYFTDVINTIYNVNFNSSNDYYIRAGIGDVHPDTLLYDEYILEFASAMYDIGAQLSKDDETPVGVLPTIDLETKIAMMSECYDIKLLPQIMHIYMYEKAYIPENTDHVLRQYMVDDVLRYTIADVVAVYRMSRKWEYSGWQCISENANITCGETSDDIVGSWTCSGVFSVLNCATCKSDESDYSLTATSYATSKTARVGGSINSSKINAGILEMQEALLNVFNFSKYYFNNNLKFAPIGYAKRNLIIKKAPTSSPMTIIDLLNMDRDFYSDGTLYYTEPYYVFTNVDAITDISACDTVNIEIVYNGNTRTFDIIPIIVKDMHAEPTTQVSDIDRSLYSSMPIVSLNGDNLDKYGISIRTPNAFISSENKCAPINKLVVYGNSVETKPISGLKTSTNRSTISASSVEIYTSSSNMIPSGIFNNLSELSDDGGVIFNGAVSKTTFSSESILIPVNDDVTSYTVTAHVIDDNMDITPTVTIFTYDDNHALVNKYVFTSDSGYIFEDFNVDGATSFKMMVTNVDMNTLCVCRSFDKHSMRDNQLTDGASYIGVDIGGLYSIGDHRDTLRKVDGTWVIDRSVFGNKLYVHRTSDTSSKFYNKLFINDVMCDCVYDIDASSPDDGVYVFHIVDFIIGGGTTGSGNGVLYLRSNSIMSKTVEIADIPSGASVADGATAFTAVDEYALSVPEGVTGISYIPGVTTSEGTRCSFITSAVTQNYPETDVYGNNPRIPNILTVACKLTPRASTPREDFIEKLRSQPIEFYTVPHRYYYNTFDCEGMYYPITSYISGAKIIDVMPRYEVLPKHKQDKLDDMSVYPDGCITILGKIYGYELEYVTNSRTEIEKLNDDLGGLRFVRITESEYNTIAEKDQNTVYFII